MAEVVPITGGPETAKIRNIIGVPALIIITFGIYFFVWWYKINRELADLGAKHQREDLGDSPLTSLVAVTIGWIIIVPPILSIINTYKRVKRAQQLVGVEPYAQANPWIYGLPFFISLSWFSYGYLQNELNKVWRIDSGQVAPALSVVDGRVAFRSPGDRFATSLGGRVEACRVSVSW